MILLMESPEPMELTQPELADHLSIANHRINEIVFGKGGISSEMARFPSKAFNAFSEIWLNLQSMYDLTSRRPEKEVLL